MSNLSGDRRVGACSGDDDTDEAAERAEETTTTATEAPPAAAAADLAPARSPPIPRRRWRRPTSPRSRGWRPALPTTATCSPQVGACPPLTTDDLLEPALAAEGMFRASSLTPTTGAMMRSLGDLTPSTLAVMHGLVAGLSNAPLADNKKASTPSPRATSDFPLEARWAVANPSERAFGVTMGFVGAIYRA